MTYEEAIKILYANVKIVNTNGNDKFPYHIDRLLIMPVKRDYDNEGCIIKWVVGKDIDFKRAIEVCGLSEEDFDVYVYTQTKKLIGTIEPILLSEYLS